MTPVEAVHRRSAIAAAAGAGVLLVGTVVAWTTDHVVLARTAQPPAILSHGQDLWSDTPWLAVLLVLAAATTLLAARIARVHRLRARGALVTAIITIALAAYGVARPPGRPIARLVGQSAGGYALSASRYSRAAGRYVTLGAAILISLGVAMAAFAAPEPRRSRPR